MNTRIKPMIIVKRRANLTEGGLQYLKEYG
jgi:hypothetical protein